jgi:phenylacetate-CoA ligase
MLDVTTTVNGTLWPGIPGPFASQLLAMQCQFESIQWLSPEEILARQSRQLGRLLAHAFDTTVFYRRRLESVGLSPDSVQGPDQWRRIPLLTRADMQQHQADLVSCAVPDAHGPRSQLFTSGSTGRPVMVMGTALTQLFWNCCTLRDHLWHRRAAGSSLAAIRSLPNNEAAAPDGDSAADWGPATRGIVHTGPSHTLNIHSTVDQQAAWLLARNPDYLLTYPSNLLALVRHSQEQGWRLPRLREARTFGELLEPRVRAACRAAWDVRVIDMYSSQEVGYIALECPTGESYHVQSENALVEVLDDQGQPCAPGEVGRVVVTSLHNFATPLLRYDIGDYAEVAALCPCGRGLPALRRIMGRQRNMALLPDGRRRWPAIELAGTDEVADFPPVHQFQLIQRTRAMMEMLLVVHRPLTPEEEERLRGWVITAVGHPFEVRFCYVDAIPRSALGKFEDFRCEVDAGDEHEFSHG